MKKIFFALAALVWSLTLPAQENAQDLKVLDVDFSMEQGALVVAMEMDFSAVSPAGNQAIVFTPVLYSGTHSVQLPSAGLYSRGRFYSLAREKRSSDPLPSMHYYVKNAPSMLHYTGIVQWQDWMAGARLRIDKSFIGCCGSNGLYEHGTHLSGVRVPDLVSAKVPEPQPEQEPEQEPEPEQEVVSEPEPIQESVPEVSRDTTVIVQHDTTVIVSRDTTVVILAPVEEPEPEPVVIPEFVPEYVYVLSEPQASSKESSISGEAYVVFASGKTEVDFNYRDNAAELGKIRATIDSVRADTDMSITRIVLRGHSSPDGSYAANGKLAEARTAAIKNYLTELYGLPDELYSTEFEPENWVGFKEAVIASDIPEKEKILSIIDTEEVPDTREARIRGAYPQVWKKLAADVFPLLRRTDYKVSYTIRSYTTREEVLEILRTNPAKLSSGEFFLAAEGMEPGSPEFNSVFAIAARVCPFDDAVNINAANAAMMDGNLGKAAYYLDSVVGNTPEAVYANGVYSALSGDWEAAERFFTSAEVSGIPQATAALSQVKLIREALSQAPSK